MLELVDQGLTKIELESRIAEEQFCRMIPALYEHWLDIVSLHSFFPKPENTGLTQSQLSEGLAAQDDSVFEKIIELHGKTMDYAQDLECHAVVVHLANLNMNPRMDEQLDLLRSGKEGSAQYAELAKEITAERARLSRPAFSRTLKGLEALNLLAEERGMFIGVETRVAINEVPSLAETIEIFKRFSGSNIKYWIDVGHAQIQSALGWYDLDEFYASVAAQTIGAHIHDVSDFNDHHAPGTGKVDFAKLLAVLPAGCLTVVEVLSHVKELELRQGIQLLRDLGYK